MTITLLETNNSGEVIQCGQLDGPSFESKLTKKAWPDVIYIADVPQVGETSEGFVQVANHGRFFALEDFDAQTARYMRVGGIVI